MKDKTLEDMDFLNMDPLQFMEIMNAIVKNAEELDKKGQSIYGVSLHNIEVDDSSQPPKIKFQTEEKRTLDLRSWERTQLSGALFNVLVEYIRKNNIAGCVLDSRFRRALGGVMIKWQDLNFKSGEQLDLSVLSGVVAQEYQRVLGRSKEQNLAYSSAHEIYEKDLGESNVEYNILGDIRSELEKGDAIQESVVASCAQRALEASMRVKELANLLPQFEHIEIEVLANINRRNGAIQKIIEKLNDAKIEDEPKQKLVESLKILTEGLQGGLFIGLLLNNIDRVEKIEKHYKIDTPLQALDSLQHNMSYFSSHLLNELRFDSNAIGKTMQDISEKMKKDEKVGDGKLTESMKMEYKALFGKALDEHAKFIEAKIKDGQFAPIAQELWKKHEKQVIQFVQKHAGIDLDVGRKVLM
jgi:hypothetical protein